MCRFHYSVDITANVQVLSQRTTRGATDTAERDEGDGLSSGHLQAHINTCYKIPSSHARSVDESLLFSFSRISVAATLRYYFDNHILLPVRKP